MEKSIFKKKLTNIIKTSEQKKIDDNLDIFFNGKDFSMDFLQDFLSHDANDLKFDLFSKYEKYLMSYAIAVKKLINIVVSDYDNNKDILLYPILFNIHHAVELFYKTYKIFYYIMFGSCMDPVNAIAPPCIKDLNLDNHRVYDLFNDEEIIFICKTFGINKKYLKQIASNYKNLVEITGLNNLFEQTRFPQEQKKFVAIELKEFKNIEYIKIYLLIESIDNILITCMKKRYSKRKISKAITQSIVKKTKELNKKFYK